MRLLNSLLHKNALLIENILSLVTIRGLEYVLSFITLPYLVRVLDPGVYGSIVFAQAIGAYGILFTSFGFNMTAPRDIAKNNEPLARAQIFGAVLGAKLCLLGVWTIVFVGLGIVISTWISLDWLLYIIIYLAVIGDVLFPVWFFQGVQHMRYITYANIVARIITTMGLFYIVHSSDDYLFAAFFQSIVPVLAALISWFILIREYPEVFKLPSVASILKALYDSWDVFLASLAINLYTSSTVVILGLLTNNIVVGYFSAANKMVNAITRLLNPISQAIYPYISILAAKSEKEAVRFLHKLIIFLGGGMGLVSLLLFIFSQYAVEILLGPNFIPSITAIRIMAFLPFIIALSNIFGVQTMMTFGMQKTFRKILISAAFLHLGGIIPFCWFGGGEGAATMILLTEIFVTLTMGFILKKKHIIFS